jgi:mannose-1-phosphate guanylyltransferase
VNDLYAVILAGGSGTRLWPRSRTNRPKQFLDLISDRTMIQQTVDRLLPILPPERICFIVGRHHEAELRRQLPAIPAENIYLEPCARGTGPCVGLAAMYLRRRDPNATMVSLHADHYIEHEDSFREALGVSYEIASRGMLVTMGATPTYPETGYGYIERGEPIPAPDGHPVFRIARFREKPDRATAERMIASGRYYWNTGMFTWRLDTIMSAFERWMPEFAQQLATIESDSTRLEPVWGQIRNETIDRGIMERADNSAVVSIDIGWNDIGSWATLYDLLPHDTDGNVVHGDHLTVGTTGSLIHAEGKLIATIGLNDVIVVETDDAILICAKDRAQDVKQIVDQLKQKQRATLI